MYLFCKISFQGTNTAMTWIHQGVQWLGGVIVRGAVKVKRELPCTYMLDKKWDISFVCIHPNLNTVSGRRGPNATAEEELQLDRPWGAAVWPAQIHRCHWGGGMWESLSFPSYPSSSSIVFTPVATYRATVTCSQSGFKWWLKWPHVVLATLHNAHNDNLASPFPTAQQTRLFCNTIANAAPFLKIIHVCILHRLHQFTEIITT